MYCNKFVEMHRYSAAKQHTNTRGVFLIEAKSFSHDHDGWTQT